VSTIYFTFLVVGLFLLINFFKRKIDRANRTIELGETYQTRLGKFPHVRKSEYEKSILQVSGGLAIACYLAVTLNFNYAFICSWVVLAFIGLSFSISAYMVNTMPLSFDDEEITDASKLKTQLRAEEAKKVSLIIVAVTIALSGNWAFQINKNQSQKREMATQEVSSLTQTGWCSNFQDINVYDGGSDVVKSGGWPCIYIGSISSISFSKEGKIDKMCLSASLNRENGPPGDESFQLNYKELQVCALDDWNEGWSESAFSDKIYAVAKTDLNALQSSLCRNYGFRMGELNYSTYC